MLTRYFGFCINNTDDYWCKNQLILLLVWMKELITLFHVDKKMVWVSVAHITKYMQNSHNDNFEEIWPNQAFSSGANFAYGKIHPVCKK